MHADHHSPQPIRRAAFYWHVLRHGYRYANLITHHAFGVILRLTVFMYFLFGLAVLVLRYEVMPNIDHYKPEVERLASEAIGRPVTISTIYASWRGFHPYLFLGGVSIYDQKGREALKLPGVSAIFSWWSLVHYDVRLRSLEISRPDLTIERDAAGKLFVAGIPVDTGKSGDGQGLDWILSQDQIVIRDGSIRWRDGKRGAPELALNSINFAMRNQWHRHRFALNAAPPVSSAAPIDIRADFNHPFFVDRISNVAKWTGELYLDLRDTDLAAWKAYIDYPVELNHGRGAVRAWLNFDHAKVADFTADLRLSQVSTRLRKDLLPLDLTYLDGRISLKEKFDPRRMDDPAAFGKEGHALSLVGLTMRTADGLVLPPTTISEIHTPATADQPEKTEVNVKLLDLQMLARFMERLPLPVAQRKFLTDFSPRGQLTDFKAQWQGAYPEIASYSMNGKFRGLSLKAQEARPARSKTKTSPAQAAMPAIPGFENLSGRIDANTGGGAFSLASEKVRLDLPSYFVDPVIALDRLKMQASWTFQGKDKILFDVASMEFAQEGLSGSLSGKHLLSLSPGKKQPLGVIDLTAHLDTLDVKRIGPLLPAHTPAHLRDWLSSALESGTIKDADIRVRGDLSRFPFQAEEGVLKAGTEFTVSGRIENGRLNYLPGVLGRDGKLPLWPQLEDINGMIAFDRTRMSIHADSAKSHDVALSDVNASIADLLAPDRVLMIDGRAAGPLQELVGYTADSPVAGWIGRFTDETRAGGNASLDLKLQLPLARMAEAKVEGALQFAGNDITLMDGMPPLSAAEGRILFDERGFTLDGLRAGFLGGPVAMAGGTQRDGSILVKASGTMGVAGLRKAYAAPAMQRLADRISGSTRYNAAISVRKKRPEITIESSLQGIALNFPAPLHKAAGESMPFKLELAPLPPDGGSAQRDEMKLSLGSSISARYQRSKTADADAEWKVASGGIGINVPAPQPDSGLIANVNLKSLNIDEWRNAVSTIIGQAGPEAAPARANALDIAQYIEPEILAARATELVIGGKALDNVVVGASHQQNTWQANIDSDQASGYVTWNEGEAGRGLGKVTARLASLTVPKSAASDVTDLLEGKNDSSQIPGLDIVAENFELYGKKLGRMELIANNVPGSATREWRIGKLSLANSDAELKATGKWSFSGGESASSLNYVLDIDDSGKLLDRLGFPNVMRNGKGRMSGVVNWKGLPFSFDIPSLSGQIRLEVNSGQIMKVDIGGAKLLGVLSLQGLPRLGEVVADGLSFESIAATASIAQGVAKTDNFKMRSVNMTVLLDGAIDIARESQNMHAVVIPDYNLGTASAVYALAVNPVIGVGTFLAQLFLREPIARALTVEYRITGPWKEPVYTKLDRKTDPGKAPSLESEASTEKAG